MDDEFEIPETYTMETNVGVTFLPRGSVLVKWKTQSYFF